ncbi:hypothetical protein AB0A69_10085 [Streptomyces sp. NPDC045431]|uniref:hypothetical protein n=1 Tax=Streptomyces sp. NPDC045431 TaxID=3155613 RepID=UPI0033EB1774
MIRNVIGSVLALVGATAAVWSPFRAWYDGRLGRHFRVADLFSGISDSRSELWVSILLPLAFGALVALVGVLLRSRVLVGLAACVVLGFTILWMVRQAQVADGLAFDDPGSAGLGWGVVIALVGGALLLLGAAVMAGRPRRRRTAYAEGPPPHDDGYDARYDDRHGDGYGGPGPEGPGPPHRV